MTSDLISRKLWVVSFILFASFWSTLSAAYVLPGQQLMESMVREMGKADSLAVSQKLVSANGRESASSENYREMLSYRYPNLFRLESHSGNNQRIVLMTDSETIVVSGSERTSEREAIWDYYVFLLFFRSDEVLAKKLRLIGLNTAVSSLGRFDGKPCYVLGATYPDLNAQQIWIDKDTFLPFRWLVPESTPGTEGKRIEFKFFDWQKKGKTRYPLRVQIMEGKIPVREIQVEGLEVNPSLEDSLFDAGFLKKRYPVSAAPRSEPGTSDPQSEIRKTIEDFKKRYH